MLNLLQRRIDSGRHVLPPFSTQLPPRSTLSHLFRPRAVVLMSPFSVRTRKQPQASTSTSAPKPVPLETGPSTDPPQNDQGPSGGRFSEDAIADMKATALDITQTITSVVTEVADVIPVPGLKIGLLGLAAVVEKIQVSD